MKAALRPVEYGDYGWICAAYKDWPKGIVTDHDVAVFLRRWIERGKPTCRVLVVDDEAVGLITWYSRWFAAYIWNVVISPQHRGKGYFNEMARLARIELEAKGVVAVRFNPLAGTVIYGRYPNDQIKMGDPL